LPGTNPISPTSLIYDYTDMKFAEPLWLFAGAAVIAVLLWAYRRFDARQRAALADFASSHLLARLTASFSPGRRRIKRVLFLAATAFVFVALARPQLGYHWEEQKRRGIDILFAIDTSKSMLTQDVAPDRLTRAKLAITDLVRKLEGDRVGLIAFAGDAFLQAPLTSDYDAFQESLDAVDVGVIPRGGTDISSAIQEAQVAFGNETRNKKILVLLTDGEDLEAKGIESARAASQAGLTIYTIGVGSATGGLIPVPNGNGGTDFLKDESGQYVKSHLDENTLKQIAEVTGGLYEPLGQRGEGLETLYRQALASVPKQDLASRTQRVYNERFQWPLIAGLVCLFASLLIGTRRRRIGAAPRSDRKMRATAMASLFVLTAMMSLAKASPQSAEQAYQKGDFSAAEKQYQQAAENRPETAPLQFDVGASAYKNGEYDNALPAFQKALSTDQIDVQQQTYYDMGNTQYRLGQKTEKSTPETTIKTWQQAVQSYDAALKLKSDDTDAQFNRDFVEKKLEQLQKQQQQKKDQDKKDQQKQDQQKQDQNNKDQSQSGSKQDQKNDQSNQGKQDQKQNGSQQNQSQDNQANNQGNQKQSPGSQQNQAQNGKQGQQSQANQNSQQNQNGQQGQQPQNSQAGQQQTAGNQDGKSSSGGKEQQQNGENSSQAQNGEKQAGPRGMTIPDKDKSNQQKVAANEAQTGAPGQMSQQEAKDLLNSLKNNEHALPVTADARNTGNHSPDQQVFKDW
jgi:Ca-activated chloride channel family protein